jgi:hypothetical protein
VHCHPVIVTDAGFRGPWLREVEALGWDWVGRIRNSIKYFQPEIQRWCAIRSLYRETTPRVRHLGLHCLSPRHRWGFALRYAQTKNPRRFEMLLLIAVLATFILW